MRKPGTVAPRKCREYLSESELLRKGSSFRCLPTCTDTSEPSLVMNKRVWSFRPPSECEGYRNLLFQVCYRIPSIL
jgi:hypothetical protein